jgi:hypothetical protein
MKKTVDKIPFYRLGWNKVFNFTNSGSSSSGITKKSDRLLANNKKFLISHKSIKCLGNCNFDVFRYKNSLTFICHQHQDLTIAKNNNFEIYTGCVY